MKRDNTIPRDWQRSQVVGSWYHPSGCTVQEDASNAGWWAVGPGGHLLRRFRTPFDAMRHCDTVRLEATVVAVLPDDMKAEYEAARRPELEQHIAAASGMAVISVSELQQLRLKAKAWDARFESIDRAIVTWVEDGGSTETLARSISIIHEIRKRLAVA